jgi:hypothetical protein
VWTAYLWDESEPSRATGAAQDVAGETGGPVMNVPLFWGLSRSHVRRIVRPTNTEVLCDTS